MTAETTVAVTGANGYVGGLVVRALAPYVRVVPLVRKLGEEGGNIWRFDMAESEMTETLRRASVSQVVHVAWEMKTNSLETLRRVCVAGTRRLLNAATAAGIQKVIFISTISAFEGARSAYGRSKLEAESLVVAHGGIVLRLGLVYGQTARGVFGALMMLATRLPVIPSIWGGSGYQYLLHERSFSAAILRAVRGDFSAERRPLTLAHPVPIRLTELMRALAKSKGREVRVVSVPWFMPYASLRLAELARIPLALKSDSLISFVHQNPTPDFTPLFDYQLDMLPFTYPNPSGTEGSRSNV